MRLALTLPVIALISVGCAALPPGACDPANRDASLIHKMRCDTSGSYRQVIDQKETDLLAAEQENALFRASLEALEAQRASLGQSVQEQQKAHTAAIRTTRQLLDQIKAKNLSDSRLRTRLSLAENDLAALQAQPVTDDEASLAARRRQAQELEQMVKRLRASVLQAPQ